MAGGIRRWSMGVLCSCGVTIAKRGDLSLYFLDGQIHYLLAFQNRLGRVAGLKLKS